MNHDTEQFLSYQTTVMCFLRRYQPRPRRSTIMIHVLCISDNSGKRIGASGAAVIGNARGAMEPDSTTATHRVPMDRERGGAPTDWRDGGPRDTVDSRVNLETLSD